MVFTPMAPRKDVEVVAVTQGSGSSIINGHEEGHKTHLFHCEQTESKRNVHNVAKGESDKNISRREW